MPRPAAHPPQPTHSHAQRWLLAHDIRDPRRLNRVWRYLSQEGWRLQNSVYLIAGNRQHIQGLIDRLRQLIDEREDDVRIYPLTENTRIWGLGTQFDDEGITLSDAFMAKLVQKETSTTREQPATEKLKYQQQK